MSDGLPAVNTTIARKYLMGLTGLALVGFAIAHLVGNLALLIPDGGEAFNAYGHFLESLGELFYLIEILLLTAFVVHIVSAIRVTRESRAARPIRYAVTAGAGGPSMKNKSSTNMIVSGLVLLAFLVLHLVSIKWGPEWESKVEGVRDLAALTVTRFKNPLYSGFYVFAMLLLGAHLRHGFWSAFQSLGINHPRLNRPIRTLGLVVAALLAVGFLFLPVFILIDPMGWYAEMVR